MPSVRVYTRDKIDDLWGDNIVDGAVVGGNLILTQRGGAEINAGSVIGPEGPPGTVTDGSITMAKLAAAVINRLIPAGVMCFDIGASAPAGWINHNQAIENANTLYPDLWNRVPASWKVGTTLNVPNLTDTLLAQTGGSAAALGVIGGSMTSQLIANNIPPHNHAYTHDHPPVQSSTEDASHYHGVNINTGYDLLGDHLATRKLTLSDGDFVSGIATNAGSTPIMQMNTGLAAPLAGMSMGYTALHQHNVSGNTGTQSALHTHVTDIPSHTGVTDNNTGTGAAFTTRPRHLGVNVIIKAH